MHHQLYFCCSDYTSSGKPDLVIYFQQHDLGCAVENFIWRQHSIPRVPTVVSEPPVCGDSFDGMHMIYIDQFGCGSMRSDAHVGVEGWFRDLVSVIVTQRS